MKLDWTASEPRISTHSRFSDISQRRTCNSSGTNLSSTRNLSPSISFALNVMKSSPYRPVPLAGNQEATSSPDEIDVTDVATSGRKLQTPGKMIDFMVVSDGANMRFPFLAHGNGIGSRLANPAQDPANMQLPCIMHTSFTEETLCVDPGTGVIVPFMASPTKKTHQSNSESSSSSSSSSSTSFHQSTTTKAIVVFLLFIINLLNYMDRYTISGVLIDVRKFYNLSHSESGLLQTVFIVAYMLFAPLFGYLGDRYNRVVILVLGISFWSLTTLMGSFVPAGYFWLFKLLRGMVGIGEASYSTVAPTIIADLFSDKLRSTMLTLFYFAIPVGSGMGYIVGSRVRDALGDWQWALRVTPVFGFLSVILLLCFMREPPRGQSDGTQHQHASSSWLKDLKALLSNRSFTFSTWGFTAVCFVSGALAHWTPTLTEKAYMMRGDDPTHVALIFGGITVAAGISGVVSGTLIARLWKNCGTASADALVCAGGLLLCAPALVAVIQVAAYQKALFWLLVFVAEFFLCLNWAVVADILFYVVIPTRRSTAEAFQILISHLFGDAGSPYMIGKIADLTTKNASHMAEDALEAAVNAEHLVDFEPLKNALYMTVAGCIVGGLLFLLCAKFIVSDKLLGNAKD